MADKVSRDEFEEVVSRLNATIISFSVVVVLLFLLVIFLFVCIYFIISKLRYHERCIDTLEENELSTRRQLTNNTVKDHVVDIRNQDSGYELRTWRPDENPPCQPVDNPGNLPPSQPGHVHPDLTVVIEKETVHVYGDKPQIGQVMNLAQDFYKCKTNTDIDFPAESVQILDKTKNIRAAHSKIFTDDWGEGGVPTSLLFDNGTKNFQDILTQNKGIFIHKTVGPSGGLMDISGVILEIPPNAIKEPTLISIGVMWDEAFVPNLSKKQTLLSPMVLCQPSGMTFDTPVKLSFPHAAVNLTRDWTANVLKREGNLNADSQWENIALTDYSERKFTDSRVELHLNHFTLYTCVGESQPGKVAVKGIQVVAFAASPVRGELFKPRVYCLNNYAQEINEVQRMNRDINPESKVCETSTILVYDNDKDLMVDVAHLCDDWKLRGLLVEPISFELVWHALKPHCTLVFEQEKGVTEFFCEVLVYQVGRDNFAGKLKIAEKVKQMNSNPNNDGPVKELIDELITLLDPENAVGSDAGNWRDLAEEMGCGLARIRWLKAQISPTKVLVTKWIEEEKKSFQDLVGLLLEINRPDAADEVTKRLELVEPEKNKKNQQLLGHDTNSMIDGLNTLSTSTS